MSMVINIKGKYKGLVPNIGKRKYRFGGFEGDTLSAKYGNGKVQTVDVAVQMNHAWNFAVQRANIQDGECNKYFKSLRGKTLKQVLDDGDIVIHSLVPKEGFEFDDMPAAESAGRDIGINPLDFFTSAHALACTLIHELAHVAGATTDKDAPNALEAEEALNHCKCSSQFSRENLGFIEQVSSGSRYG